MTEPCLSRLATERLARHRRSATPALTTPTADGRVIDAIAGAIAETARARRKKRLAMSAASLLAAVAAVAVIARAPKHREPSAVATIASNGSAAPVLAASARPLNGALVLLRGGREISLDDGRQIERGDRIVAAADGRATVNLTTGTRVVLESGADFGVDQLGREQRFALHAGALVADVAKLAHGERFVVRTGDAEVEVRGTSFRVSVEPGRTCDGIATRVAVSEGTVVVRSSRGEDVLHAGNSWPPCAAPAASPPASTVPVAVAPPTPPLPRVAPPPAAPPTSTAPAASELAEQNRLFAEAKSAGRRGATMDAVARYDAFLARYPNSQLAESAMAERMRLLARADRARGAAAGREYLVRHPRGFARQEAAEIAGAAP